MVSLITLMGVAWGCTSNPPQDADPVAAPAAEPAPVDEVAVDGFRSYEDVQARLRMPVPWRDYRITSRHFDPAGPIHQIRHQLSVALQGQPTVRIDVWDDPQRRPIAQWAEQTVPFLLDDSRAATTRRATTWNQEGLILEQAGSPQAHPRRTALVAAGGRVFRITCLRAQDERARAACERIVAELEPEVAP